MRKFILILLTIFSISCQAQQKNNMNDYEKAVDTIINQIISLKSKHKQLEVIEELARIEKEITAKKFWLGFHYTRGKHIIHLSGIKKTEGTDSFEENGVELHVYFFKGDWTGASEANIIPFGDLNIVVFIENGKNGLYQDIEKIIIVEREKLKTVKNEQGNSIKNHQKTINRNETIKIVEKDIEGGFLGTWIDSSIKNGNWHISLYQKSVYPLFDSISSPKYYIINPQNGEILLRLDNTDNPNQKKQLNAYLKNSQEKTTIKEEARQLKKNKEEYEKYENKEDSLFVRYANRLKHRPYLHVHRRPDLRTLNAPLAYYYIRFNSKKNKDRYVDYLYAISNSKDTQRRLNFVLKIKKKHKDLIQNWDYLIIKSANSTWANNYIDSVQLNVSGKKRDSSLDYHRYKEDYKNKYSDQIISHWADSLNKVNKEKVYAYLTKLYANGNSYYSDADFELLYKLKPTKAQNELANYLYDDKRQLNEHALVLFSRFNTKNIEVANKIMSARTKSDTENYKYANTAIFFMNPEQGRKEVESFLKKEIQGKEAMEDNYFNAKKVLRHYATSLCKSAEDISILINYIKSYNLYVFGDITRIEVLETIYKSSPDHFEKVLLALRTQKIKTGKDSKILKIAKEIKAKMILNK